MEQLKWTTPIKSQREHDNLTTKSPVMYKTPVKQYEATCKHTAYQNNMGCISVLPNHITPPSGLTKFIARNPFESDLTNRLHLSMMSPTVFSKVSGTSQQSPEFSWSVDELALMQPAKIEEFPTQQIYCTDPETEIKAQAAIDQFFKKDKIIPSPWEIKKKDNRAKIKIDTPVETLSDSNSESSNSKKDGWCQTILTFPAELPSHIAEILKPYFKFTQDQNVENDDANLSNNSLRRKLFFNQDDSLEDKEETSVYSSSVKMNGSLVLSSSPPESGMLIHGAPVKSQNMDYCRDTSQIIPNISPIYSTVNMSRENLRSRSRSVARLDFTNDMSIDESLQRRGYSSSHSLDESLNKIVKQVAKNKVDNLLNSDSNAMSAKTDVCTETKASVKNPVQQENNFETENSKLDSKHCNALKCLTDSYRMITNESCMFQQTNTALGISDQHNSVQDTGYQTYSMNSITNVTNNYNGTPVKQKACWGDRILLTDDEFRHETNIKNIFCSTPSRSNRETDIYFK
ncbi:aurora kinase A activator-like protein bora [Osmia lignaria lignaria]|uniref:aurora kinase A activator-like protein bora n=1 Tax=Osmia lignaria lignaria TaxID=1437193 RepID=UPI001478CB3D|nr:protein aurora borealis [Osmia lignaria]XP_034191050.1 protein aurora borealis [Osmia lignaria]